MIIKELEEKQSVLDRLKKLAATPDPQGGKDKWASEQLRKRRAGIKGEKEAAYVINLHYGDDPSWMIIHDLRVRNKKDFAQIDHLLINEHLEMWVCESKHFSEGLAINKHGEFTSFYEGAPQGMASPIEQNNNHILLLKRVLESESISLPKRFGFTLKPSFKSLILISNEARISRPNIKIDGLESVIKVDTLSKKIKQLSKKNWLQRLFKKVEVKPLEIFARELAKLHIPPEELGQPETEEPKYPQRFCDGCGEKVSTKTVQYCWVNREKMIGKVLCQGCQKQRLN